MKSIAATFHRWRGIGRAAQGDFFICSVRLGFVSIHLCRICLVERLQALKAIVDDGDKTAEERRREFDGR